MAKKDQPDSESSSKPRELPKTLQGIEIILTYLHERNKESSSIRNISDVTGVSMRVAKNILLQLEKLGQVERVTEKNQILPKWVITKLGKKVVKKSSGIEDVDSFNYSDEALVKNIKVPKNLEDVKRKLSAKQEAVVSKLNTFQTDLSKILGTVINIDHPAFEDLISFVINRLKFLKQRIFNLSDDPVAMAKLKRKDEKTKKVSKDEAKDVFTECYFFNSLILNKMEQITQLSAEISRELDNDNLMDAFNHAKTLRESIRVLTTLIYKRESIDVNSHVLSEDALKDLSKNKIHPGILDDFLNLSISVEEKYGEIEEIVLIMISKLDQGEKQFNGHITEITESIPLYAFYNLILDEKPNLNVTIDQLERVIEELADEGYIHGMKTIQSDEDHYLKLVQLKARDITEDEGKVIFEGLKLQKFTLADMVEALGWKKERVLKVLIDLTDIGILKYSKSFLHGERWYVVSEENV